MWKYRLHYDDGDDDDENDENDNYMMKKSIGIVIHNHQDVSINNIAKDEGFILLFYF